MAAWMNQADLGTILLCTVLTITGLTVLSVGIAFAQEAVARKHKRVIAGEPIHRMGETVQRLRRWDQGYSKGLSFSEACHRFCPGSSRCSSRTPI